MRNRFLALAVAALAGLWLAACSPSEADQRKAFIAFLNEEVMARQGVRVVQPNEEKRKSFGPYAEHYAVITDFHARMNANVAQPMQEIVARGVPRTVGEIVARKSEIAAVRAGFGAIREALDAAKSEADAKIKALKQPPDLAQAYDAVYVKLVEEPVKVFREVFPVTDESFASVLGLVAVIEANRPAIKLDGARIEIANPAVRAKVQAAMDAMTARQSSMAAAQTKMRQTVMGR